jgi:hypothetical protein
MGFMVWLERSYSSKLIVRVIASVVVIPSSLLLAAITGCNGLAGSTAAATSGPPTYLGAVVVGSSAASSPFNGATGTLAIYNIDDTLDTYSRSTSSFADTQQGTQVNDSGSFTVLARGLRSLSTTYTGNGILSTPIEGSYAVELAGQAGGLVQLATQPATPLVATETCPSLATAQIFQFITLPTSSWNPANQTAFGSVSIDTSGSDVNLSSIQQFTLPVKGGSPGAPASSYSATEQGACSPTPYGNTISVPASTTVTNPGQGEALTNPVILGVGPSGLLVESIQNSGFLNSSGDVLGAGTGAIGVPQPSSAIDTSTVVGAQYLGFIYGAGGSSSSTVASFGFPTPPSDCSSVAAQTSTLIYGGDFPSNNPASSAVQSNGGYGNCDFAIDLGTQSTTSNGLYPSATVWMGSGFSANSTQSTYSFPAVAIVGQLQGKFVILLIGEDSTQPWSLYLMQSN